MKCKIGFYIMILCLILLAGCNTSLVKPSNPNPANNSTNIPLQPTLTWDYTDPKAGSVAFNIYFGENANNLPLVKANSGVKTYTPSALKPDTEYFWRVEVINPNQTNAISGDIWKFMTISQTSAPLTINIPDFTMIVGDTLNIDLSQYVSALPEKTITFQKISGVGLLDKANFSYSPDHSSIGEHTVTISATDGESVVEDSFTITVTEAIHEEEREPNDDFGQAQQIVENVTYQGSSLDINDEDFYKFTAEQNNVTIYLDHMEENASVSDFTIYLCNDDKSIMAEYESYDGLNSNHQTGVVAGQTYYLVIEGGSYSTGGGYQLRIVFGDEDYEVESNDDFGTANLIQNNVIYHGESRNYEDEDFYKFVASGNHVTIHLEHVSQNASNSDFAIYLYNASKECMTEYESFDGLSSSHQTGIVVGQTYYILIEGDYYNTGGSYTFEISFDNEHFEVEPNDDFGTANIIQDDIVYHGESLSYDDEDYYKFVAEGNNVSVYFEHLAADASDSDFDIYLYNASKEFMTEYESFDGLNTNCQTGVVEGETYYLLIEGDYYNTGGDYQFTISYGSEHCELEPNHDFGMANLINENIVYLGESRNDDDYDYYRFVANSDQISLRLEHVIAYASDSEFSLYLYDSNKNLLADFESNDGLNSTYPINVETGKTYFLLILGGSWNCGGKYKLSIIN